MPQATMRRFLLAAFAGLAVCGMGSPAEAQSKSVAPTALIVLKARDSKVTPQKFGYSATGGGTVTVTQPSPDIVIISMSGVAAAGSCACETSHASLDFVLDQEFEIEFAPKTQQTGKLEIEARLYGLLRTEGRKGGIAQFTKGFVSIAAGEVVGGITLDPQTTACGEGLAITSVRGPVEVPVVAGCFHLHQEFGISATQPKCLIPRKSSADFAPPPTLDNRWIAQPDPFREANRTNNGFQVTIRLVQDPLVPTQLAPPPAPLPE